MKRGFIATIYGTPVFFQTQRTRKTKGLAKEVMAFLGLKDHHWLLDTLAWLTPAEITPDGNLTGGYYDNATFAIVELDSMAK